MLSRTIRSCLIRKSWPSIGPLALVINWLLWSKLFKQNWMPSSETPSKTRRCGQQIWACQKTPQQRFCKRKALTSTHRYSLCKQTRVFCTEGNHSLYKSRGAEPSTKKRLFSLKRHNNVHFPYKRATASQDRQDQQGWAQNGWLLLPRKSTNTNYLFAEEKREKETQCPLLPVHGTRDAAAYLPASVTPQIQTTHIQLLQTQRYSSKDEKIDNKWELTKTPLSQRIFKAKIFQFPCKSILYHIKNFWIIVRTFWFDFTLQNFYFQNVAQLCENIQSILLDDQRSEEIVERLR